MHGDYGVFNVKSNLLLFGIRKIVQLVHNQVVDVLADQRCTRCHHMQHV